MIKPPLLHPDNQFIKDVKLISPKNAVIAHGCRFNFLINEDGVMQFKVVAQTDMISINLIFQNTKVCVVK